MDGIGALPASVTIVRVGTGGDGRPCVVVAGLCNLLRAWSSPSKGHWERVLEVDNVVRLPRGRTTSHPFRCLSRCIASQRYFAAASSEPDSPLLAYCTSTWSLLQQLRPAEVDEHVRERFTPSCLEATGRHLACGSREGTVALWRLDLARRTFDPCWHGGTFLARADEGPVAAVSIDQLSCLIVAAYGQASGSVDGAPFTGEQSVAAWCISSGALVWRVRVSHPLSSPESNQLGPTLALLVHFRSSPAERLIACSPASTDGDVAPREPSGAVGVWLLHAHAVEADGEWPMFATAAERGRLAAANQQHTSSLATAKHSADTPDVTHAALSCISVHAVPNDEQQRAKSYPAQLSHTRRVGSSSPPPSPRRVLSWEVSCDAHAMAIGFAGGGVAMVLEAKPTAQSENGLRDAAAGGGPGTSLTLWSADGCASADVGAVSLIEASTTTRAAVEATLRGSAPCSVALPMVLAGTAAGSVQLWGASHDGAFTDGGALSLLISVPVGMQLSTLASWSGGVVVGGSDGRVLSMEWHAFCDHGAESPADDADEYAWRFSPGGLGGVAGSGAGSRGGSCGGLVSERREAFDGWVRTADYERGLQDLLLGRAAPTNGARPSASPIPSSSLAATSSLTSTGSLAASAKPARPPATGRWVAAVRSLQRRLSSGLVSPRGRPSTPADWERYAHSGALPPPELAARSHVVHVRGLLDSSEVNAVLRLASELPFARKHPAAARRTCYLSSHGAFARQLPLLRAKLLATARSVDDKNWGLLRGRTVRPRCVECHALGSGKDILHPGHHDFGSVITIDVMLSRATDFVGGAFRTAEPSGRVASHSMGYVDAIVFVSHKPHFVAEVTEGERRVLILELWEGEERTCPHRCEARCGACLASPIAARPYE